MFIRVILFALLLGIATSCSRRPDYPPPTPEKWESIVMDFVEDHRKLIVRYLDYPPNYPAVLHWSKHSDYWFAYTFSVLSDTMSFTKSYVGVFLDSVIEYRMVDAPGPILKGLALEEHLRIVQADSVWSYFGEYGFWNSDKRWKEIFANAGFGGTQYDKVSVKPVDRPDSLPPDRYSWLFDIGVFAYSEQRETLRDNVKNATVDFLVYYNDWFAAVIANRDEQSGLYNLYVGRHMLDSLIFRKVENAHIPISGTDMSEYLRLMRNDSLWSLFGSIDQFRDEASLKRLYEGILGESDLPDSAITKKLRFDDFTHSK